MILHSRFLAVLLFRKSQMSRARKGKRLLCLLSQSLRFNIVRHALTRAEVRQWNERHFVCQ